MFDRRLLGKLWLATMAGFLPLMVLMPLKIVVNDGLSWATAGEVALQPFVTAFVSLLLALYVHGTLLRRARGTGIPVTAQALAPTQEHTVPSDRAVRLRSGLSTSDRAWDVVSGDQLHFRWRPFRGRRSVMGSVTFDETSGEGCLRLEADKALMGRPGLRGASAFVALCQIVRLVGQDASNLPPRHDGKEADLAATAGEAGER
ncbi:hypothetical protein ACH47Z_09145 [Streptomyces sp. NPDC020192]|uniref:hypothetical protein n=1 Tax=Streptomyces sp. NPDC020192 TaxID=3365066 RepID=UPI0037B65484